MENVVPRTAETLAFEPLHHHGGSNADILRLLFVKYETNRSRTSRKSTSRGEDEGRRHAHRGDTEPSWHRDAGTAEVVRADMNAARDHGRTSPKSKRGG